MKDSTSALLLESFDKGGSRIQGVGGCFGACGDVRNPHCLRLSLNAEWKRHSVHIGNETLLLSCSAAGRSC